MPLVAALTVSLYLQVALIPSVVLARPVAGEDAPPIDAQVEGVPSESAQPADGDELPEVSEGDRVLAALPTGGGGVTGSSVALPSGPATALGMGESFSAQLSTGTASISLPFALPSARGRVQPALTLAYSSAGGFGVAGTGWTVGVASISRQSDRGLPTYDDRPDFHPEQDRFLLGGVELVPLCIVRDARCDAAISGEQMPAWANGWQYFRSRHEGTFIRAFWSPTHRTWRVQSKDGTNMEFGEPLDGSRYAGALEYNPDNTSEVSRWYLSREYDSQGEVNGARNPAPVNVVMFRYLRDGNVVYLSDIYDTSPADAPTTADLSRFAHHTRLRYDARPDRLTSYRAGYPQTYALRLVGVDVTSKPFAGASVTTAPRELVRRYHLGYLSGEHASLLSTVQPEGRCDAPLVEDGSEQLPHTSCPRLPALRFDYQRVASETQAPRRNGFAFERIATGVKTLPNSPPHSLDEPEVSLLDANLDGLPDVLATAPHLYHGDHALFFNGEAGRLGFGSRVPVPVQPLDGVTAGVLRLSNLNVAPVDLDSDGAVDLVHMPFVKRYAVFSLERGEQPRWRGRHVATAAEQDPKIDFTRNARNTRVMDVNGDGLVDIVYTGATEIQTFLALGRYPGGEGRFGHAVRTGPDTASLTTEPLRSCVPWSEGTLRFSEPDVHVADMNGDGLPDIVRVRNHRVMYFPGRGNGMWGTGDRDSCVPGSFGAGRNVVMDDSPSVGVVAPGRMHLADLNGDGLSDMAEVRANAVDLYINDNGEGWTSRHTLDDTPFLPNHASWVELADIDGSGTPDLVWGEARNYRYADLTGGLTPHLLIRTHNGLGRTMALSYRPATELMREAAARGRPWTSTAPMAAQVLVSSEVRDNLDRIGRPSTRVITEYEYRDPVFEGRERQFRGFREAVARTPGDSHHPTRFERSVFLLGECVDDAAGSGCDAPLWQEHGREALKGLVSLSETYDQAGIYYSTNHTAYERRRLYRGRDGRSVSAVFPVASDTYLYDTADFDREADTVQLADVLLTDGDQQQAVSSVVTLRSKVGRVHTRATTRFDDFGNVLESQEEGCVEGCPAGKDETIVTHSEYKLPSGDGSGWLWREDRSFIRGTIQAERRYEVRHEYDERGNVVRSFAKLSGGLPLDRRHAAQRAIAPNPPTQSGGIESPVEILLKDNSFDAFGHIFWKRAAGGACASTDYDAAYAHLTVRARAYVGAARADACGSVVLRQEVVYDRGLEQITEAWDANDRPARYEYDGFGRLTSARFGDPERPGVLATFATTRISYDTTIDPWTRPYSIVHIENLDGPNANEGVYRHSYSLVDGLGRTLASLTAADPEAGDGGEWIVSGRVDYDAKGAVYRTCAPFFSSGEPLASLLTDPTTGDPARPGAPQGSGCRQVERDAFGRVTSHFGFDNGLEAITRFHALSSDVLDPLDLEGASREGTFTTAVLDGHGRAVSRIERYREGGRLREREQRVEYLPTGEPRRLEQRASDLPVLVRWMRYDSLGRLVLNVEPNTSSGYSVNESTDPRTIRAYRYAYDDAGRLVGTSDARGCGTNFYYDTGGRLRAADYSPCEAHHALYTPPDLTTGDGTEAFYRYDTADSLATAIEDERGTDFEVPAVPVLGFLTSVADRGKRTIFRYDVLGRGTGAAVQLARPGAPASELGERYAARWYVREVELDARDRIVSMSTGATSQELLGYDGASKVRFEYADSGLVRRVGSSYGTLLAGSRRLADGRLEHARMGDAAGTQRSFLYDAKHRLQSVQTYRANLSLWSNPPPGSSFEPPEEGDAPTQQMLLEDLEYQYDDVGNVSRIDDYRVPSDWPDSAQPVARVFGYDDLYRLTSVDYSYAGSARWQSPFGAELSDVARAQPPPQVSFSSRVARQSFAYDAFNRLTVNDDDQHAFWDRSTGTRGFGATGAGPHQLRVASNRAIASGSTREGDLEVAYNASGYTTDITVRRAGACMPSRSSCWQRYQYEWDEVGNLSLARRWDLQVGPERDASALSGSPVISAPARAADAELRYSYAGSSRVLKTLTGAGGDDTHTLYVFDTLELRGTSFDEEYLLSSDTEQVRINAGAVSARVVFSREDMPSLLSGGQHMFLEFADHLGSNSFVVDHETGELVEYTTFSAYGGTESDYRPARWGEFREPYKLSGKEEDIEVGLIYFGARYYSPYTASWLSPDPLNIHQLGSDLNPYAYAYGSPLMYVDPNGLDGGLSLGLLLVIAIVAAVVAAASSAVSQAAARDWNWGAVDWFGWHGVAGAGAVGFVSGFVGGAAGAPLAALEGLTGAIAAGAVGGAASGGTGYLMSEGTNATGAGVARALASGAFSGALSGGLGEILGNSLLSGFISSLAGTGTGAVANVAMGGGFTMTDFIVSMGASLAGVAAARGAIAAAGKSPASTEQGSPAAAPASGRGGDGFFGRDWVEDVINARPPSTQQTARQAAPPKTLKVTESSAPQPEVAPPASVAGGAPPPPSGGCFTAPTLIATTHGLVPISDVRIGDRVLTERSELSSAVVESSTWRLVRFEMVNPDGSGDVIEFEMLRPLSWLSDHAVAEGARVDLVVEEMGVEGEALVLGVDPCPPIQDGPGRLVLATFTHLNGEVLELRFEKSSTVLEPSATHRIFSSDRNDWVPAGQLRLGERLATAAGYVTLSEIRPKPGVHRVYNLEVETDHSFLASPELVLCHNMKALGGGGGDATETYQIIDGVRRAKAAQLSGHETIPARVEIDGVTVGTKDVPVSSLRSPKSVIETVREPDLNRWLNTLEQTSAGSPVPPIRVTPGGAGKPIEQVRTGRR